MTGAVRIEASPGDALDRLTILEIKLERLPEGDGRANAAREAAALRGALSGLTIDAETARLRAALRDANLALWEVEDRLRAAERAGEFGAGFVALARSVYLVNDRRAALKRAIDLRLGAPFHEAKSHDLPAIGG